MGHRTDVSGIVVSGVEFRDFLIHRDVTNADAARVFGTSPKTIQAWIKDGIVGTPAHFVAFLIRSKIPPHAVAQLLEVKLTAFGRSRPPDATPKC